MSIEKGSRAAHERALKAAETRRRKKAIAQHTFGHVPAYSAKLEQRHNQRFKLRKPLTKAQVKKATNDQLRAEMDYWGHIPGPQIKTRAQDTAYYNAKDELRMRANPRLATVVHEISPRSHKERERRYNQRHAEHQARRGVKKQRGAK